MAGLAGDKATVTPELPKAVYPADDEVVSEHGLTSQPRRVSCAVEHHIDLFARRPRHRRIAMGRASTARVQLMIDEADQRQLRSVGASVTGPCGVGPHRSVR